VVTSTRSVTPAVFPMNALLSTARVVLVAGLALAAIRLCASDTETKLQAAFVDPASPEAKPYRSVGSTAIDRFAYSMVTETVNGIASEGAVATIPKCHLKGLPMIGGFVSGVPRIAAMKLTSLKLCNPANAPDAAEKLALDRVQADLEAGSPPDLLVQRIDLPSGGAEWRVYKPLGLMRECTACHGKVDSMAPEVRAALKEKFPDDQATGYSIGQLRGLIRVTVTPPAPTVPPKPAAKSPKA
jgi:hypothetical protein